MSTWLFAAQRLHRQGTPFVAVTVAATRGSIPREAGARMLVTSNTVIGTIGGGHLEYQAIEIARSRLTQPPGAMWRRFPLGPSLGQCCGGVVELLFEHDAGAGLEWLNRVASQVECGRPVVLASVVRQNYPARRVLVTDHDWRSHDADLALDSEITALARPMLATSNAQPTFTRLSSPAADGDHPMLFLERVAQADLHVMLFGAGHVGRALIKVLGELPCRVTWIDSRETEFCSPLPENVAVECTDTPEAEIASAAPHTCFVVMTHSHALDFSLTQAILKRGDFRYFGLIGSVTKRKRFENHLRRQGVPSEKFERIRCPIGMPGVTGKEPGVIAVAVAAELLQLRTCHMSRQAALPELKSHRHMFIDAPAEAQAMLDGTHRIPDAVH